MSAIKKSSIIIKDSTPPPTNKKMQAEFLVPFIDATINTLKIQASIETKSLPLELKTTTQRQVDIIGVISLISRIYEGSISLCFPKETFIAICNKLFGETHTEINGEIEDAAGELLNMIFGTAKAQLNSKFDYQIPKALPAVISGQRLKLTQSTGPTIVLPFTSEVGDFHLEIEVVVKK